MGATPPLRRSRHRIGDVAPTADPAHRGLQRWMRLVGGFYLLLGAFNTPPVVTARLPMQYPDLAVAVDDAAAQALIDVWSMFGLEIAIIGAALLLLSRSPLRALPLVWTVIALEVVRGIVDDVYLIARGYDPGVYTGWILIHLVIIVSGAILARTAHRSQPET